MQSFAWFALTGQGNKRDLYRLAIVAVIDFFVSSLPDTVIGEGIPLGWVLTATAAVSAVGLYYVIKLAVKAAIKESRQ